MSIFDEKTALIEYIESLKTEISDEYRAFDGDEEPGIQLTLACNDTGDEYATQTGDNSYTGAAYSFPHWAVTGVYRDSDANDLAEYLLNELSELVLQYQGDHHV